jgi:transcriptional regulator with XRE-family HTH domain
MANERLRSQIAGAELTLAEVASHAGVDPKTVERWIATGRKPHRTHRWATAKLLGTDEAYLWPDIVTEERTKTASEAELVKLYPHRGAVPRELWMSLLDGADDSIDFLVYAGLFLPDGYPELPGVLADKGHDGTKVRIALGDPDSDALAVRADEEGIGDNLAARAQLSLTYLADVIDAAGIEVRLHGTTLYNSVFRFDEDLLVNTHVYGAPAAQSPVLHLRRVPGGRLFGHYADSFERVWNEASPAPQPKRQRARRS